MAKNRASYVRGPQLQRNTGCYVGSIIIRGPIAMSWLLKCKIRSEHMKSRVEINSGTKSGKFGDEGRILHHRKEIMGDLYICILPTNEISKSKWPIFEFLDY